MSTLPPLQHHFAETFPELSVPWQVQEAPEPRLVVLNEGLARELGLDPKWLRGPEGIAFLCGRNLPAGAQPVAQGYSGHQFGQLSPLLGDGRAVLLGELPHRDGHLRDLHVKGAGRTPFARGGDGQAVLGPMLREYLVSEAMHALGVPTTRSLAVLTTGLTVQRQGAEPGAMLVRVARTHLRVGTVQYARLLMGHGRASEDVLGRIVEEVGPEESRGNAGLDLLEHVISVQLRAVAQWMRLGFIHGVMNTDNTTLSGETIDYGPCAFMDRFDPDTVFSSIDRAGRYRYRNQPLIIGWNAARLGEALLPLIDPSPETAAARAMEIVAEVPDRYRAAWGEEMARALGLPAGPEALSLADELVEIMTEHHLDLTGTLRSLTGESSAAPELAEWWARWEAAGPDRGQLARVNPLIIPRNHAVENVLREARDGDLAPFHALLDAVTHPWELRSRQAPSGCDRPGDPDAPPYVTYCGT
ncbi:protein adenylyltransferase SelO family protein [Corynebacterium uropygiale]|uniref:Protein nucleotidyltransferase YdiU n=1 Tax=Corynebacterium uropygiale TaxID=1775911 RepID=A0A9X1QSV2_9CORY|nr:protein adenylyltransferase SelO family protein [Corynebacterium uropygiale]MCF4006405.1 protein adenylyltransferase SelO family protein [Corynebacterium uropygiale]